MAEDKEVSFLPVIPEMPVPPKDMDDLDAWQAHIEAVDKYMLDLNDVIQEIDRGDFIKDFKQRLEAQGVDLDNIKLPQPLMEEIAKKMQSVLDNFQELGRDLGIDPPATPPRRISTSKRNIRPI